MTKQQRARWVLKNKTWKGASILLMVLLFEPALGAAICHRMDSVDGEQ